MRISITRLFTTVAFILTSSVVAQAQIPCEDDPLQEVPNCSFEDGSPPVSWSLDQGFGDSLTSSPLARAGSASARLDAEEDNFGFVGIVTSDCFAASIVPGYNFGMFLTLESGAPPVCYVYLRTFPTEVCGSEPPVDGSGPITPNGTWSLISGSSANFGMAAKLEIQCISDSDFVIRIDDGFAGGDTPLSDLMFSDGFESGTTAK